jgi:hypothetical protein
VAGEAKLEHWTPRMMRSEEEDAGGAGKGGGPPRRSWTSEVRTDRSKISKLRAYREYPRQKYSTPSLPLTIPELGDPHPLAVTSIGFRNSRLRLDQAQMCRLPVSAGQQRRRLSWGNEAGHLQ